MVATSTLLEDKEIDDLLNKASVFLGKAMKQVDCDAPISVTSSQCRKLNKDQLVSLFSDSFQLVRFLNDRLRQTKSALGSTKTELITSQKSVIDLQEKLLESSGTNLISVQNAVSTSVSETVKAELKTYSSVVQGSQGSSAPTISTETIRNVVKTAVREEDRGKNVMVFGLIEERNEDLAARVGEVFECLGTKPTMELSRVGKSDNSSGPRPIKVCLSSAVNKALVLRQARKLRDCEKFKNVFVRPDRSPDERAEHKLLVEELKQKKVADPSKYFYIKGGKVCTGDRAVR